MTSKFLSSLLRWGVVVATLIFVGRALFDNWHAVSSLNLSPQAWRYGAIAFGLTLVSHLWLGVLWGWILRDLRHPMSWRWSVQVYLVTEIIKYLPGNVWHMYSRIRTAQKAGIPVEVGTTSVILEPIFITVAAAGFSLLNISHPALQLLCGVALTSMLLGLSPPVFSQILRGLGRLQHNRVMRRMFKWLGRRRRNRPKSVRLRRYPRRVLVGEFIYMGLRCLSFGLIVWMFTPLPAAAIIPLLGGFSFAWIIGLILPGAPGGIGVFEAIAIALLGGLLSPGVLLGAIGFYRLISILSEVIGAGLGWLMQSLQA